MATVRKQVAFEVYTAMHTGPCVIEMMTPGRIRISIGTVIPGAASLPYHMVVYPAGRFEYAGNETVYAMSDKIDDSPFAVVTSNEAEHLIAQEKVYRVSGKVVGLAAYGDTYILMKVPLAVHSHFYRPRVKTGGGNVDVVVYEDPTVSADGTLVPALNLNRNSTNTADMDVHIGPTVVAVGTSMDTQWAPPSEAGLGQRLDESVDLSKSEDWVLKEDTNYLLRIANSSAESISLWFEIVWYEL